MSSMSEDIQCAGSDIPHQCIDRTRLDLGINVYYVYCPGKDNEINIMKSNKEGPFHMGTVSDVYCCRNDGAVQQGPVRPRVLNDLSSEEKERYKADIRATNILLQGRTSTENLIESLSNSLALLTQSYKSHLPQIKNQLRTSSNARNKATRNNARGNVVAGNIGGQNRGGIINPGQAKPIKIQTLKDKCKNASRRNGVVLDEEQSLFLAGEQVTNFDDDVDDSPENDLALNVDHIFKADQYDAFDSDVDEAPNVQTMFMVNLSSEDPIYDEAGPSHDSNTPFEVQDHDTFVDHMDEYHEVHEMQNDVQHNYVVDSNAEYTSDSNIIPYNQYLEDNEENGVQSNVSSVQNDALMSIINEMHEEGVQQGVESRLANKPDMCR
ncbi:hypothetical protein Tco_0624732 [Tanacetum coccineum]|uniref:Uncharacterized protein n=1 Tax=Tanacetum coccineum TaxID=301880 RepID=A0ABQ4WEX4_9ASTR